MKLLNKLLGIRDQGEKENLDVILDTVPEIEKEQWSALYVTGIQTNLSELQSMFSENMILNNNILENKLAKGNCISVLNAVNPGTFDDSPVHGVVVLINATSFSEYADILLRELRRAIIKLTTQFPAALIGNKPNLAFNSDELEGWLKQERDKYFFID